MGTIRPPGWGAREVDHWCYGRLSSGMMRREQCEVAGRRIEAVRMRGIVRRREAVRRTTVTTEKGRGSEREG